MTIPQRLRMSHTKMVAIGVLLALVGSMLLAFVRTQPATADVGAPPWWKDAQGHPTVCDTANYPGSYALGASYNGVQACGPGPTQGGADHLVHFFTNAWGEYEWECVELVMRYMYQVYGIAPYSAPGGKDVVANYAGTVLTKVTNNGTTTPTAGDILSFAVSANHPGVGHAAVVTAVSVDGNGKGTVTYMQQNAGYDHRNPDVVDDGWGSVSVTNKTLGDSISGWLHDPNGSPGKSLLQVENPGNGWSAYNLTQSANKQIKGAPSVVWNGQHIGFAVTSDGRLDQFAICPGGRAWCSYDLTGTNAMSGGVRAVMHGSAYEVFGPSADGSLLQVENAGTGWAVYNLTSSNGVKTLGAPGVIWDTGSPTIYAVDTAGNLRNFAISGGSWQAGIIPTPQSLSGGVVAVQVGTNIDLFARGSNGHLLQIERNRAGQWSTYDIAPSLLVSGSPGVIWGAGGPNVFVPDPWGALRQLSISNGAWRIDTVLPNNAVSGGADAIPVGSTIEVFAASW
jgi:hypothetical protein